MNLDFTIILYITLAAIFALGFVFFKYFHREKRLTTTTYLLAFLRFLSIFVLLLLLINPKISKLKSYVEKPDLLLVIDASQSIKTLKQEDSVNNFYKRILANKQLQDRFNIKTYSFARELFKNNSDSLQFKAKQTNISQALLEIQKLNSENQQALVLITDGNQTLGRDFQYEKISGNTTLLPIIVGDTTHAADLSISNLNANRYAFLKNEFPVEIIVKATTKIPVASRLTIIEGKQTVFSKNLRFDKNETSKVITAEISANSIGSHLYDVELSPLKNEGNKVNNKTQFAVGVIDEKTSVLILTSIIHPDLGALKNAIETNEQRKAKIELIYNFNISEINDYQLIILYQPNNNFKNTFQKIASQKISNFIITGTKTDWRFLNSAQNDFEKEITSQTQDVVPIYNENFNQFQFEDMGFDGFPPLNQHFGKLNFSSQNLHALLYQKIEGLNTKIPLLVVSENEGTKSGVLFGENSWKWRSQVFKNTKSFNQFDTFIGEIVQYLAANKKRSRLSFTVKPYYFEDESITVNAQFFDKNYQFDSKGLLNIHISKLDSTVLESRFLSSENEYTAELGELQPGKYTFKISEEKSGIFRNGSFSVLEFNVEQKFQSANFAAMQAFATNNASKLYFLKDEKEIVQNIVTGDHFKPVMKSHKKTISLTDWKILLAIILLSLSAEWFIRKYYGLI